MKKYISFSQVLLICALSVAFQSCNSPSASSTLRAPIAKKVMKELTTHGDTRIDNYHWLNQRVNPEVIDYLKAENEHPLYCRKKGSLDAPEEIMLNVNDLAMEMPQAALNVIKKQPLNMLL